jgi:hypothetical protein
MMTLFVPAALPAYLSLSLLHPFTITTVDA